MCNHVSTILLLMHILVVSSLWFLKAMLDEQSHIQVWRIHPSRRYAGLCTIDSEKSEADFKTAQYSRCL